MSYIKALISGPIGSHMESFMNNPVCLDDWLIGFKSMLYFGRNSSANNIISRLIVFRDIVLEENILNIRQITKSPAK